MHEDMDKRLEAWGGSRRGAETGAPEGFLEGVRGIRRARRRKQMAGGAALVVVLLAVVVGVMLPRGGEPVSKPVAVRPMEAGLPTIGALAAANDGYASDELALGAAWGLTWVNRGPLLH